MGDDQRVAVPGKADFSGGGPARTYCRDCNHLADKIAVQTGINTIEKTRSGCMTWVRKMASLGGRRLETGRILAQVRYVG
jgi:hypothetical protein